MTNSNSTLRKLFVGTAALVALFALAGSALFFAPVSSAAQAEDTARTVFVQDAAPDGETERVHRQSRRGNRSAQIDKMAVIADALGISVEELDAAREDGSTLEELAAANGTTVDAVHDALFNAKVDAINEAVAAGEMTQEQADQVIANMELHRLAHEIIDRDALKQVAADTLGITVEEMEAADTREAKEQLLVDAGVTREEIRTAVEAAKAEMIADAVADGTITQEQADQISDHSGRGKRGHGHSGRGKGRQNPTAPIQTDGEA